MPGLDTHEKYVFGRDPKESKRYEIRLEECKRLVTEHLLTRRGETSRLNDQHRLLTKVTENNLIHPSISKETLLSVADIATGTG